MKTLCLLIALFACFQTRVMAQAQLTANELVPQIGQSYLIHKFLIPYFGAFDYYYSYPAFFDTGDYAHAMSLNAFVPNGTSLLEFIDPAGTPRDSMFPAATLVAKYDSIYEYYAMIGNEFHLLGIDSGQSVLNFSDSQIWYRFPINFPSSYTTMDSVYTYSYVGQDTFVRSGHSSLEVYHRTHALYTPNAVYSNVIATHHVLSGAETRNDSAAYQVEDYLVAFYSSGTAFPVMFIRGAIKLNGNFPTPDQWTGFGAYLDVSSVDQDKGFTDLSHFSSYHDATRQMITFQFHYPKTTLGTVTLADLQGQQLLQQEMSVKQGSNRHEVGSASLSRGIYLLSITLEERTYTRRIVLL